MNLDESWDSLWSNYIVLSGKIAIISGFRKSPTVTLNHNGLL